MASYTELRDLSINGALINKIVSAIAVAAHGILNEASPTAPRKAWGEAAIINPPSIVDEMIWYLLADNAAASQATILAASDATILAAAQEAVAKRVAAN